MELPAKLVDVFEGEADVRGAWGGRGSAKTRTFAKMTAVRAYMWDAAGREGIVLCARQYMNSLDDSSLEEVKAAIRSEDWLASHFDIGERFIRTKSRRVSYSFSGLDRNIRSIKSKARILLCWVDEAEPVSDLGWGTLIPTLREDDSELWVTWNPEKKTSSTNLRFRGSKDKRHKITEMNWRDNPWFPEILERARLRDMRQRPDQYEHIWEGDFVTAVDGAYYAQQLTAARLTGRLERELSPDPLMSIKAVWDLGGTGARADATAIWICQFVGPSVYVLDYYEAVGQPLAAHVNWLRENGYGKAQCILPHDGAAHDRVQDVTFEGALMVAGFDVVVVPNQGTGAAIMRIEASRRLFPQIFFDKKCAAGLDSLGWYHEKRNELTGYGQGPAHDHSSHGADAFGLIAVSRVLLVANEAPDDEYFDEAVPDQVTGY